VLSVVFSPDGKSLASGGTDSTVKLWNIELQKELTTLQVNRYDIASIKFSPDGKYLVSCSSDNTIKLWNLLTSQELQDTELLLAKF
jgi:WD40 repeat protein